MIFIFEIRIIIWIIIFSLRSGKVAIEPGSEETTDIKLGSIKDLDEIAVLEEGEEDGDAEEPDEADDDVQGEHLLLVPRTKSDNHQLEINDFLVLFKTLHNLDKVGGELGEGEEKHGVEKLSQDSVGFFFYIEDDEDLFLDILGENDRAESDARDEDEEAGKEADVGPKVGRALHVLPEDVSRQRSY